jgi:hypothetical protein
MRAIESVILIVLAAAVYGATTTGALSGVVVEGNGDPIAGALVLYRTVPTITQNSNGKPIPSGSLLASGVRTAADGTFTITNLPPASSLCLKSKNTWL